MSTTLELLGYGPSDRVLIIHADDVGCCHASNAAAFDGMLHGSLTCGSTLVTSPWFAETAKLQREQPGADIGVHLTLTAEYETYRWRSLTGDSALHAPDGGMWRDVPGVLTHVPPHVARAELRAQIELALASGIDVTHIDTHMGTVMHPWYLPAFVDLAIEFRLPLFFIRPNEERLRSLGPAAALLYGDQANKDLYADQAGRLDERGWPLLDNAIIATLGEIEPEDKERRFQEMFGALPPGLTHFLVHPAQRGPELEAMAPGDHRYRAAEGDLFARPDIRHYCEHLGIKLTGYREIRARLRQHLAASA